VATTRRGRRSRFSLRTIARGWPWYYESAPIHPAEVLLRAIPNTAGYYKEEMGDWQVNPYTFQPNKKRDIDGMSFFREHFTTPGKVASTNKHPDRARVARVMAWQLQQLGLEAIAQPDEKELPGHVIVPGMRFVDKNLQSQDTRRGITDLSQQLARLATKNGVMNPLKLPMPAARK
jgi:hypothetical protein